MTHPLRQVLDEDPRYPVEAYEFIRDALSYAHDVMGLGMSKDSEVPPVESAVEDPAESESQPEQERHLTGQELCEAGRRYALEEYGLMAKVVLNNWGIYGTSDFGELVYNLIRVDMMRKSPTDRREDFDDVFEFEKAFLTDFDFGQNLKSRRPSK